MVGWGQKCSNYSQAHNSSKSHGGGSFTMLEIGELPFGSIPNRGSHTDFGMGGDQSPPIGGGQGSDGGDWRVIRDKIKGIKKISVNP